MTPEENSEKDFGSLLEEEIDECLDKYFGEFLSYEEGFEALDDYLSSVRHELRTPLAAAGEGMNLVLDGLGNKQCDRCMDFLQSSKNSINNLNRTIEDLLSPVRFKANAGLQDSKGGGMTMVDKGTLEKLKYEIMTRISHEVRTPLTIVKESLALVLEEIIGPLNEEQKKFVSSAKGNIDRLVNSITTILETPSEKIIEEEEKNG
ncbi:MAG: histidine kinase dimerization/phospho-acceptor domain-containing protein [Thermodesulfobacteriota bacterium]